MQVVKVFFTILIIVLVTWLAVDTVKLIITKIKDRKQKKKEQENKKVVEQVENDNHD